MKKLPNLLLDPLLDTIDIDNEDRFIIPPKMLEKKPLLKGVLIEFHHIFYKLDQQFFTTDGLKIELGAEIKPIRDSYPEVLATDVIHSPTCDRVLNAEDMEIVY